MVEKPGSTPPTPPSNPNTVQGPQQPQGNPPKSEGWSPKPMKWLGMSFDSDQVRKLWNIISQNIANQINKDKEKAIKAIKRMNPDEAEGSDP